MGLFSWDGPVILFFHSYHINFNIKFPTLISLLYCCFPVFLYRAAGPQGSRTKQMLLAYRYTAVHTALLLYCCSDVVGGWWVGGGGGQNVWYSSWVCCDVWEMALLFFISCTCDINFNIKLPALISVLYCCLVRGWMD